MKDDETRRAIFEAAEYLARSRVRLEGLVKADIAENHPMRAEEERLAKERFEKLVAMLTETGYKVDRSLLVQDLATFGEPENRDAAVRQVTLAVLLEASAAVPEGPDRVS